MSDRKPHVHHWRMTEWDAHDQEVAAFKATLADAAQIIETLNQGGIPIVGPAGWGNVQMDGSRLALNGYVEFHDAHEPFTFDLGRYTTEYVDTERRNYDVAVTAILLRAKDHYGEHLMLASDGDWAGSWAPARQLCEALFGVAYGGSVLVALDTVNDGAPTPSD